MWIGLGYVGLPLAVEFAKAGMKAVGFDIDAKKVEQINRGESYIGDVTGDEVKSGGRVRVSSGHHRLRRASGGGHGRHLCAHAAPEDR